MTGSNNTSANPPLDTEALLGEARAVLTELGVSETGEPSPRPLNQRSTSILLPCQGTEGQPFLLKYFVPPLPPPLPPPPAPPAPPKFGSKTTQGGRSRFTPSWILSTHSAESSRLRRPS